MQDTVSGGEAKGEVLIVEESGAGERIDSYLASRMPSHISRSRVQSIIRDGGVLVDNLVCSEPKTRLKGGEKIDLEIPPPVDAAPAPEIIALDIVHEDEHLIVVNKPPGLVVHPGPGNWEGTLVNALLHHCGDSLSGIGGVRRPGIVHRLDKDTSGLMVVAKTDRAHAGLATQFEDHGKSGPLERLYVALTWGIFDRISGKIDAPLGRSPKNRLKRAVASTERADAREAVTYYKVLKQSQSVQNEGTAVSLVECRLETGRTHQIRVHLSHIGHPLLGDALYGKHFQTKLNALEEKQRRIVQNFNRQALHARTLGFEHPDTGETMKFDAEPPEDFMIVHDLFFKK